MKSIQQKLLHESEVLGEISFVFLKKKRKKKDVLEVQFVLEKRFQ